jgi:hypothetical protein
MPWLQVIFWQLLTALALGLFRHEQHYSRLCCRHEVVSAASMVVRPDKPVTQVP